MYDHNHESAYDRELAAITDEKAAELRAFLDAADAALTRDGLTKHETPPLFRELRQVIADLRSRKDFAGRPSPPCTALLHGDLEASSP